MHGWRSRQVSGLVVFGLVLAACGIGKDESDESAVPTASVSAAATEPVSVATQPASTTTTTSPPTTTSTTTSSTSTSTTTTTIPGSEISRDTALAANECIELWSDARFWYGPPDMEWYPGDEMNAIVDACDRASDLIDVDLFGASGGSTPVRKLAIAVLSIAVAASLASFQYDIGSCPAGRCEKSADDFEDFLGLLGNEGFPASFVEQPGVLDRPELEDFEGLTVSD